MRVSTSMSRTVCWITNGRGDGERRRKWDDLRGHYIFVKLSVQQLTHKKTAEGDMCSF